MKIKSWCLIGVSTILLSNVTMANSAATPKTEAVLCKLGFMKKSMLNYSSCTIKKAQLCAKLCNTHRGMCTCSNIVAVGDLCVCADGEIFGL